MKKLMKKRQFLWIFFFSSSLHGNLKIKFSDNKNVEDSYQPLLQELDKKLGNREIKQQFNHDTEREGDLWKYQ